ncbi:hypothetical protein JOF56_000784 [Kibdelosporangium banguiense]|uniref:Transposase n=1 Tax=Kibdelosporangium banguiense TaxID=1365924 RepID=A0ABS4T7L0_9PSEU|nr:hypothetical protein [Kibdelosporangium banguiense]MBP2320399.1 hypothetical protein [Kibdelosporangium banguiense]
MRKQQRRESARAWIQSGANVTVKAYCRRYGVDRYTAYDDLTAVGFPLGPSAEQWARRPAPVPSSDTDEPVEGGDDMWTVLDGRKFFVAGYTSGGVPYGVFEDEIEWLGEKPDLR